MVLLIFSFAIGFFLLSIGAEGFVRGGVILSHRFRVPEYVIGATLVSMGTSLPEAITSFYASWNHVPDISVSNIIGSNIFNIGVVLGLSALISPVVIKRDVFSKDAPAFLFSAVIAIILGIDGNYDKKDGVLFILLLLGFLWFLLRERVSLTPGEGKSVTDSLLKGLILVIISPLLLFLGSRLTVSAAVKTAEILGVSQWIIGVTVVAFGTSLPEVFTSVVASIRGRNEIALGNVMGSNVFNIYFVLGGASLLGTLPVHKPTIFFDLPVTLLFHLVLVFMIYDKKVGRESGLALTIGYIAFLFGVFVFH